MPAGLFNAITTSSSCNMRIPPTCFAILSVASVLALQSEWGSSDSCAETAGGWEFRTCPAMLNLQRMLCGANLGGIIAFALGWNCQAKA